MAFYTGELHILEDIIKVFNIRDYDYKKFKTYSLTLSDNAYYLAVWADSSAGVNSGKLQIATQDGFFVIDLEKKALYDRYTQTIKGRANETLISDDIEDITGG